MGWILNKIDKSIESGFLAKADRAMCRQEAREHDQAARRFERRGDHAAARELRAEADRLRRRGGK
jgi:hypothetical protein